MGGKIQNSGGQHICSRFHVFESNVTEYTPQKHTNHTNELNLALFQFLHSSMKFLNYFITKSYDTNCLFSILDYFVPKKVHIFININFLPLESLFLF